eukprot:6994596-Pyramimonas_sp.AAC.3
MLGCGRVLLTPCTMYLPSGWGRDDHVVAEFGSTLSRPPFQFLGKPSSSCRFQLLRAAASKAQHGYSVSAIIWGKSEIIFSDDLAGVNMGLKCVCVQPLPLLGG